MSNKRMAIYAVKKNVYEGSKEFKGGILVGGNIGDGKEDEIPTAKNVKDYVATAITSEVNNVLTEEY